MGPKLVFFSRKTKIEGTENEAEPAEDQSYPTLLRRRSHSIQGRKIRQIEDNLNHNHRGQQGVHSFSTNGLSHLMHDNEYEDEADLGYHHHHLQRNHKPLERNRSSDKENSSVAETEMKRREQELLRKIREQQKELENIKSQKHKVC